MSKFERDAILKPHEYKERRDLYDEWAAYGIIFIIGIVLFADIMHKLKCRNKK
jgi:hypothetical protein